MNTSDPSLPQKFTKRIPTILRQDDYPSPDTSITSEDELEEATKFIEEDQEDLEFDAPLLDGTEYDDVIASVQETNAEWLGRNMFRVLVIKPVQLLFNIALKTSSLLAPTPHPALPTNTTAESASNALSTFARFTQRHKNEFPSLSIQLPNTSSAPQVISATLQLPSPDLIPTQWRFPLFIGFVAFNLPFLMLTWVVWAYIVWKYHRQLWLLREWVGGKDVFTTHSGVNEHEEIVPRTSSFLNNQNVDVDSIPNECDPMDYGD